MTSYNSNFIVEIFQQLLKKNNTNAYRLSKEKDIDRTYLSKLFSGAIAKPGKNKIAIVAQALNIEPEQLQLVFSDPEIAIEELDLEDIEFDLAQSIRSKHDWGAAPDGIPCYERKSEIAKVRQLIEVDRCRMVTIFGMGGIGKTNFTMEIARQLQTEFDRILWRTVSNVSLPEIIVQDALRLFSNKKIPTTITQQIADLLQCLRDRRCLLILDQVETILSTGNSLEVYQNGCQLYGELFKQIAQTQHQSCLVLVSSEKPRDVSIWEGSSALINSVQLRGSIPVSYQILKDKNAIESPAWDELIAAYHGHPLAIKIVGGTIKELFGGNVVEFLQQNTLFLGDLEYVLHEQYHRLSDREKYIINIIAQMNKPLSLQELTEQYATQLRCSEIMNSLNCLRRRSLIDIVMRDKSFQKGLVLSSEDREINQINFYTIQPIVRKYITSQN